MITCSTLDNSPSIHFGHIDNFADLNREIIKAYEREKNKQNLRQTHHFHGRFENTYIDETAIPEFTPLAEAANAYARQITGKSELKHGFWFNEMHPGHRTSLHNHDETDEVLSCVYYLTCPENSGRLIIRDDNCDIFVEPEAGKFVFFMPSVEHEVGENKSSEMRLSVAFNFGPVEL